MNKQIFKNKINIDKELVNILLLVALAEHAGEQRGEDRHKHGDRRHCHGEVGQWGAGNHRKARHHNANNECRAALCARDAGGRRALEVAGELEHVKHLSS